MQEAAFGKSAGSVDAASLARDVVRIAQERRNQTLSDILAGSLDRFLGAGKRLPEIDGMPVERRG
jgi:hypothetical protein